MIENSEESIAIHLMQNIETLKMIIEVQGKSEGDVFK